MNDIVKISLSRKGFDSSAGAMGSPVIDNRFISLPIPEAGSGIFYNQLKLDGGDQDFLSILRQLGAKQYSECHMDPNLNPKLYGLKRENGWEPAFGQDGNAASQLSEFEPGDIFLFFGKFQHVHIENGNFKWRNKRYFHAIYGFLEIGEVVNINTQLTEDHIKLYGSHPHVANRDAGFYSERSTLFIPAKNSIHGFKKTSGIFNFHSDLVLTRDENELTDWLMPLPFRNKHFDVIGSVPRNGRVNARGRGQEFVGETDKALIDWIKEMIQSHT